MINSDCTFSICIWLCLVSLWGGPDKTGCSSSSLWQFNRASESGIYCATFLLLKIQNWEKKSVSNIPPRIYCISLNKIQFLFDCPFIMPYRATGIMLQPSKYEIATPKRSSAVPWGCRAWACSGWRPPPRLPGSGRLWPPQGALRLCDTISGVAPAEETYRNKPKWAQDWGGRKSLPEHQIPPTKVLRTPNASNPDLLLRESETVHLNTQRDTQGASMTPGKRDR